MLSAGTVLDCLEPLGRLAICRKLGRKVVPDREVPLPSIDCLSIWCYALLSRLPFLSPEQRDLLFDELQPELLPVADDWEVASRAGRQLPGRNLLLVFYDKHYAVWTGSQGFLDLRTGTRTLSNPRAVETIGYDLWQLYRTSRQACQAKDNGHAGNAQ